MGFVAPKTNKQTKKQTKNRNSHITVLYVTLEQLIQGDSEVKVNIFGCDSHFGGLIGRK